MHYPLAFGLILIQLCLAYANLQEAQNQEINPLNAGENLVKDNDKRTVFSPIRNYGWAKHVGISPFGQKVVLGYSPVDLKYVPVIKPIKHGFHFGRPKVHFHRPIKVVPQEGWKPVVKPLIPSVPVHSTVEHVDVHLDHHHHHLKHFVPSVPLHDHHHVDHVHLKPVVPVAPAIPVATLPRPIIHYPAHAPVVPVAHPAPVPVHHPAPAPVVPVHTPVYKPFVASPPLYEVTKPNLGVLPLGATFPAPVLQDHLHIKPVIHPLRPLLPHQHVYPEPVHHHHVPEPIEPHHHHLLPEAHHQHLVPEAHHHHLVPEPHHHHLVPEPHQHVAPVLPAPAGVAPLPPPGIHPLLPHHHYPPGTSVEYHGTRHFAPINGKIPEPFFPVQSAQPQPPYNQFPASFNPVDYPQISQAHYHPTQEAPVYAQPAQQPSQDNSHFSQQHFGNQIIQPGQSDLQFPLHLPQHPFLSDGRQGNYDQQIPNEITRPSITLEAPFQRRSSKDTNSRESTNEKDVQEEEEDYDYSEEKKN